MRRCLQTLLELRLLNGHQTQGPNLTSLVLLRPTSGKTEGPPDWASKPGRQPQWLLPCCVTWAWCCTSLGPKEPTPVSCKEAGLDDLSSPFIPKPA